MMDDIKKRRFEEQRKIITEDLDVTNILDELYASSVFDDNDLEVIRRKATQIDKASYLCEVVLKGGNSAYNGFVAAVKNQYPWLYDKLDVSNSDETRALEEQIFYDALVMGDIPRQPPHYVDREEALKALRNNLRKLTHGHRIVLHGMKGSGKSCLAAAALRNKDLLKESFKNRIFWLNLGETRELDQILSHLYILYERLTNDTRDLGITFKPVSMSALQESGDSLAMMKFHLKSVFLNEHLREALLILDDVCCPKAADAFDVGCKVLITSQNRTVVTEANTIFMEVTGGFTEKESLTLFANCIETTVEALPIEATKIHRLCKGVPMLIALIGSLLGPVREGLLDDRNLWSHFIDKLTNNKYELKFKEQLFSAISLCVENLRSELRDKYYSFSIFVEDVNISIEVLQTLWNLDKHVVLYMMNELENKSLVVSYYNQKLKTYVYGIHDLLLAHLKHKVLKKQKIEFHNELVLAYKRKSANNFANLPNDNYIYQYIAYHLSEAELYEELRDTYFDLNFLGAKIKVMGIADLLRDFQIYKETITNNDDVLLKKWTEFYDFIKINGQDLYIYQDTDIIQCGLQQRKDGFIYKAAAAVAVDNPRSLYLHLQVPQENICFAHTMDIKEDVSAACFTINTEQILVGTETGAIKLWEQNYSQNLHSFVGHEGRITYLQLNPEGDGFLSVSDDGKVKLWSLEGSVCRNSNGSVYDEHGFTINTASPRLKQSFWQNLYGTDEKVDHSKKTFQLDDKNKIISASYANTSDYIVTGSSNGTLTIFDIETGNITLTISGKGHPANCVIFSFDDSLIICTCDTNILLYEAESGEYVSQFCNKSHVNSLLIVPGSDAAIIAINDTVINLWTWTNADNPLKLRNPSVTEIDVIKDANYICGAVTDDGQYLVAGSTDHLISMWHISTATLVQKLVNNNGLAVCLDTSFKDDTNSVHILLSGSDDKTVKQWHIQAPNLSFATTAKILPIFDTFWSSPSSMPRIAAADSEDKVQIMNGHNLIIESDKMPCPIKAICFSVCGNKVAVGLTDGRVMEFDYKSRQTRGLMHLYSSIKYLKFFAESPNSVSDSESSSCQEYSVRSQKIFSSNSILVVGTESGILAVYKYHDAVPLRMLEDKSDPVVQCFFLKSTNCILSVSISCSVKMWKFDGSHVVLVKTKSFSKNSEDCVTMAALSEIEQHLAITMSDGTFEIYKLKDTNYSSSCYHVSQLDTPLRCCCFSQNGKILAIGGDNGSVVIWSLESKNKVAALSLHKSGVRNLLFAPCSSLILVSIGEQIAWWDVSKLLTIQRSENVRRRSGRFRPRPVDVLSSDLATLNISPWLDKEGKAVKPHLLSAIKLRGLYGSQISASYDFTTFCTVDNSGYLYVIELLKQ